jgi:meiotically up-regulated gene 157 (Mug157) protein
MQSVMGNITMNRQAKVLHVPYRNAFQNRKKEKTGFSDQNSSLYFD